MTTVNLQKPASEEMKNWQLTMLYAQLQLLGDHVLDHERCPCEMKDETAEFCVAKHLTAIAEGYCTETIPMTGDESLKQALFQIRNGATDLRREYLKAMTNGEEPSYNQIAQFARDARKELEPYLWKYKQTVGAAAPTVLHQVASSYSTLERLRNPNYSLNKTGGELKMADPLLAEIALKGETYIEALIIGERASKQLTLLVDTGATYVGLKQNDIDELGLHYIGVADFGRAEKKVKLHTYSGMLQYDGQTISITVASQKMPVLGYQALELLELKVNPVAREVEVAQDPILAEVTSQICSTGICMAKPKKKGMLPICSPSQAKALRRCSEDVKAKLPSKCKPYWSKPPEKQPEECYNPFAVCRSSIGCRLGGSKKYEAQA